MKSGFKCRNCQKFIPIKSFIGTHERNHCPFCLYSLHVDETKAGDRKAFCHNLMEPLGLTFKKAGLDKWGKERLGELMLIHRCCGCGKISINRIASDDNTKEILEVFTKSLELDKETKDRLRENEIILLSENDLPQIKTQLFGK